MIRIIFVQLVAASLFGNHLSSASDDDLIEEADEPEGGTPVYDLAHHQWGTHEATISSMFLFFSLLLLLSIVAGHYVTHVFRCTLVPEAAVFLMVGMAASAITTLCGKGEITSALVEFSPTVFFIALLPPIIFYSGYTLEKRHFFSNFGAIAALAVVGTSLSTILVGSGLYGLSKLGLLYPTDFEFSECLAFGALISATDPVSTLAVFAELKVDPNLFYLVFGESVINDAVGVVLFKTFTKFVGFPFTPATAGLAVADFFVIFIGSTLIGFTIGLFFAFVFKHTDFHGQRTMELAAYSILVYVPSLVASAMEMSGIVSTLFAGIYLRHYAHGNLSQDTQSQTQRFFHLLSYISETTVFLNIGLSVFALQYRKHYRSLLIFWATLLCLLSRAVHVYPLTELSNKLRRAVDEKITKNKQHMIWFAGLRGAVAIACAKVFPDANGHRSDFLVTTMIIVLLTVFTMGTLTTPMLDYLKISTGINEETFPSAPPSKATKWFQMVDTSILSPRVSKHNLAIKHGYTLADTESSDSLEIATREGVNDEGGLVAPRPHSEQDGLEILELRRSLSLDLNADNEDVAIV